MAEFILGRIKFVYRNNWASSTAYVVDDVVTKGGKTFICIDNHTSSSIFETDYDPNPALSKWNLLADGQQWRADWSASTDYNEGDLVKYGGLVYICNTPHTSATYTSPTWLGLEQDQAKWDVFATSLDWKGSWSTSTRYKVNDIVSYNGYTYICITKHISAATASLGLENDQGKWQTVNPGIKYLGSWVSLGSSYRYKLNDLVKYGADLWICTAAHTSTANFEDGSWSIFLNGFEFENSWSNSTTYQIGDIVTYGGYSYVAKQNHTGKKPSAEPTYWDVYTTGFSFEGDWNNLTTYKIGSVVRNGGYTYLAELDCPSISSTATATTVSTDPTNPNTISADTTGFVAGMIVYFGSSFGGIVANTKYYILSSGLTGSRFKISTVAGGSPVTLTTTTGQSVSITVAPEPENTTYWSKLNSGFKWRNNPATYTAVAGTVQGSSLGINQTFDITRTGTVYSVTVNNGGSYFVAGDQIKILGTALGGISPANDLLITVSTASSGVITAVTHEGISVTWTSGTLYVLGDVVFFGASSYTCIQEHVGSTGTRPDNDITATYWNIVSVGAEIATLTTAGDTLYYSPIGPTRLPIGRDGQVLRVKDGYPSWETYGHVFNAVYVGPTGVDLPYPQSGFSIDQPWKTVRYACKQIEEGYRNPQAKHILQTNKTFLIKEAFNYLEYTYKASVTGTSSGSFLTADTSKLNLKMPIVFEDQTGSLTLNSSAINSSTTYYVKAIVSNTSFTVSSTPTGSALVAAGTGTATAKFSYNKSKAKRDAGIVIEGLIYDISRGGNYKTTANTLAFYDSTGTAYITTNTELQITQFIQSHAYLKSILPYVLSNTVVPTSYQTLNSDTDPVYQIRDTDYTAESDVASTVSELMDILIDGLTQGDTSTTAIAKTPNTTINIKTGTYLEVLPIVVPEYTALVGDELRSTVVQPKGGNDILINDQPKTKSALERVKAVLPSVLSNTTVSVSSGNTATQEFLYTANDNTLTASITNNTNVMVTCIVDGDNFSSASPTAVLPTPTGGTGNAYTAGYFNAARLIKLNRALIIDEVQYLMNSTYGTLWNTTFTATQRAQTLRDAGYIVDAVVYDLTYGGNLATVIAGRSYYSNGSIVVPTSKTETLACQARIKDIIDNIAQGLTTGWTKYSSIAQDTSGTAGTLVAAQFAQARVQEIYDATNTGTAPTTTAPDITWVSASKLAANTAIVAATTDIQAETQQWIQDAYPLLPYNITTCDRDIGYFIDALRYDMMFGSNYLSIKNGESYRRALTSSQFVIDNQLEAEVGMIGFLSAALKEITGGGTSGSAGSFRAIRRVESAAKTVYNIISSGFTRVPSIQFTTPTGYNTSTLTNTAYAATGYATGDTSNFGDGKAQIVQNYDFIVADTLQYYANGAYGGVWTSTTTEGRDKGKRDIKYILDAIQHDMTYGGNYQASIAGSAYYSSYLLNISEAEKPAFIDLFGFMKTLIGKIVRKDAIVAQSGNTVTRVTTGTAGSAAAGAFAEDRVQNVIDWITNGEAPTQVAPYYGWASTTLQNAYAAVQAKRSEIAADATSWVQKNYQSVVLDLVLTTRDAGLVVDAIAYDMVLGTNFNALSAGRRYLAGTTSTEALLNGPEKDPTLGAIDFIKFKTKTIAAYGAVAQTQSILSDIINKTSSNFTPKLAMIEPVLPAASYSAVSGTNVVGSGSSATFNFVRTAAGFTASVNAAGSGYAANDQIKILGSNIGGATPANDITVLVTAVSGSGITTVKVLTDREAVVLLEDNRDFLLSEVIAYIDYTYPTLVYNKDLTVRDAGYILDAVHYDLLYGGDFASQQAGQAYYSFGTSEISSYVKTATLAAINRLKTTAKQVIQNTSVTITTGNTKTQVFKNGAQLQGSSATATMIDALITKIYNYVDLGLTSGAPSITVTTIATGDTFTSNAHGLANGDYIVNEGADANGLVSGTRYYVVSASTNTFKLAATYGGTALTSFTNGTGLTLSLHYTNNPYIGWVSTDLQTQYSTLMAARSTLTTDVVSWIDTNYPNLVYDTALAARDAGLAVDAACFDFMFNSNFRGVKGAQSYARPQSSALLKGILAKATRESFKYLTEQILDDLTDATAITRARKSLTYVIDYLAGKSVDEDTELNGTTTYNVNEGVLRGVEILRANTNFLANESSAWVIRTFGGTATSTSSSGNLITTSSSHKLSVGDPVKFSYTELNFVATSSSSTTNRFVLNSTTGIVIGMPVTFAGTPLFGGIVNSTVYYVDSIAGNEISIRATNGGSTYALIDGTGIMSVTVGGLMGGLSTSTTYYVLTTPSVTTLTVTETQFDSTPVTLTSMVGSMHVGYAFDETSCKRDMTEFVNALVYDTQYTGNYKSKRAAILYFNAIKGSKKSDMWHVRNGTGVRNMTMNGLEGTLSIPNNFGTRRPEAGSYTSLDPGFGPYDTNAWVFNRSCYVQNCTLFGTGATALKIDGALHAGGNRSIVANDYTTFISDGIGTWCSGSNALTELVSVFAYYSYAGYIADLGAKIRATNGNSSYGTYGVLAEGVDTYEEPIVGALNNRGAEAYITNVVTDGAEEVLRIEFANAGQAYTNAEWTVSGSGYNATAVGDEFRDRAVTETRLIDLNDGYGYGGSGYITAANAAQISTIGTIVLAASDTQLSSAYIGMRVIVTAGTGAGQVAAILTYTNGSKEAKIYKESFTNLTVTASNLSTDRLTVASTASLYANMPIYLGTAIGGASANTLYYVKTIVSTTEFTISTSSGGATFDITSTTSGQTVTLYAAGWDHLVPGKTVYDALDLTSTYIVEPRITYTAPGYTATARTLPSTATWKEVTYSAGRFIAISSGATSTATSTNGTTWSTGGNLPSSTTWQAVAYGGGEGATATAVVGGLGGIGAQLTATITNGQVTAINIIKGGYGYLTPPTIKFSSGLAAATAVVLNGEIVDVVISIPGSGYVTAPTVTVRTDIITSFTMNSYGKNYTSAPTVTVSGGGSSNQATGTAVVNTNNGISSITVGNSGGTGYTSQPTVTILDANAKFVAIPSTASAGTTKSAYQTVAGAAAGSAWTASTGSLPNGSYAAIAFASGYWVAVGGTSTGARSVDADTTWNAVTLPTLGAGTYSGIAYGHGVFIAISTGNNATAVSTTSGSTWSAGGSLPSSASWSSIAYGNGRFVAIASGSNKAAVSVDKGTTWVASNAGLPASATWTKVAYGQGVFVAVASGTTTCAISYDGLTWNTQSLPSSSNWNSVAFGNPSNAPIFAAISNTSGTIAASIRTGAQAQGRMKVASNTVTEIRMIEPGSGYPAGTVTATTTSTNIITTSDTTNLINLQPVEFTGLDSYGLTTGKTYYVTTGSIVANTSFKVSADATLAAAGTAVNLTTGTGLTGTYQAGPIITQVDPNKTRTAPTRVRMANGALANPGFTNRGNLNTTATANVTGDGYSDLYQASNFINVSGLFETPRAGANVEFASIPDTWFKLVAVTNKLGTAGNYSATFQINPALSVLNAPDHGDVITTRLKYSQVRLTGHDFLYIGTGNFSSTNYPFVDPSTSIQSNQAFFSDGGRVFFTSTDQDGNFNVGNLFAVQQATGTATLNASAFNLSGLQSLQLGTVSVGAGSAVITSFSTDPYFTANSDNILPTQKAVKSYITAQIGGGQSSLNVNTLTSGVIYVANNTISTTSGVQINVRSKMYFQGGIDGDPVALAYFMQR